MIPQEPPEESWWEFLELLRWGDEPICAHCGSDSCYLLNSVRTTSTGKASARRLWKCDCCRQQFSVLTGTEMHGSKIPVRTWILVMFELASGERLTGRSVARRYNLTVKSACRLLDVLEREDEHWGERVGAAAPAPRRDDFLGVFERFG